MKCVATIPIIDVIPTATATSLRGAVKWSVSPMAWHCSQLPCRLTGGYSPLRSTRSSFRSGRYDRRIWDAAAHCGRTMFATTAVTAEHRGRCSLRMRMILVQPKSRTNQGDGPYGCGAVIDILRTSQIAAASSEPQGRPLRLAGSAPPLQGEARRCSAKQGGMME